METNPPPLPARRPWWRHWFFQTIVCGALALVLAVVAFYVIEHELGERDWRKYQAGAAARGVKLHLMDYVKAPISEEENYAAAPIFQKLFADPGSANKIQDQFKLPTIPQKKPGELTSKHIDLERWQKAFVSYRWIPSQGSDPASDVLVALQRLEQPLSEIRQASPRPKSRWPVKWEEDFGAMYPHVSFLMNASTVFVLRATAFLEQGKPEEAIMELRHVIRAADSLKGEPSMLPVLGRIALWNKVMDCAEQGLAANQWKDEQLRELSQEMAKGKMIEDLVFALTSERGMGNGRFDKLAAADRSTFANAVSSIGSSDSVQARALLFCIPRGWMRRNQVEYNQLIDLDVEDIDAERGRIDPRFSRSQKVITANVSSLFGKFNHLFTSLLLPVHESLVYKAMEAHTRAQQLRMLCAAIQYWDKHGDLPTSLDSLVPEFLAKVPIDPMDDKPLRYRRTNEGGCVIWSIGKNRIDDGGIVVEVDSSRRKALDWGVELPPLHRSFGAQR